MRWRQELTGHASDLAAAAQALPELPVRVVEEDGRHYLEAVEFESQAHRSTVRRSAKELLYRLNGTMGVLQPGFENVSLGELHEQGPDGYRASTQFIETPLLDLGPRIFPPSVSGEIGPQRDGTGAPKLVELAARDTDAHEALALWAARPRDLYRIFEIIKSRGGVVPAMDMGAVTRGGVDRFTHTFGRGRHARPQTAPPRNPMGDLEADRLIGRLLRAWLESLAD